MQHLRPHSCGGCLMQPHAPAQLRAQQPLAAIGRSGAAHQQPRQHHQQQQRPMQQQQQQHHHHHHHHQWQPQHQHQHQQPRHRRPGRAALHVAAASGSSSSSGPGKDPPPSREDRASQGKADFSAYWSLKFREFFSGRRAYLEQARKRQEPPEVFKRLDAQIALQEERLEAARMAARRRTVERIEASPELQQKAAEQNTMLLEDVERARDELRQPRIKLVALTALQLRAAVRAALLAPFTLPAAAAARWRALFAGPGYEQFLLAEGERVWAWRNRTENERWFWEVFAMGRLIVPVLWTLCYQAIVPNNLLWAVFVPYCFISWQNGRVMGPGDLEWWLTMIVGLYIKCWHQVCWLASLLFQWW